MNYYRNVLMQSYPSMVMLNTNYRNELFRTNAELLILIRRNSTNPCNEIKKSNRLPEIKLTFRKPRIKHERDVQLSQSIDVGDAI